MQDRVQAYAEVCRWICAGTFVSMDGGYAHELPHLCVTEDINSYQAVGLPE